MDYTPHSETDVRELLEAVGAGSVEELFAEIPAAVRFADELHLPAGLSEAELMAELTRLAAADCPASGLVSFLGAGVYDHYVPAIVDAIVSRGEYLTAYTPYQPERSQGVLQSIFEYQSAICELTGMEVSNASMYDAGTALAEASFLAGGQTRRARVIVSEGVHPEYRQVLATESAGYGPRPETAPLAAGAATDLALLQGALGDDVAAVVLQQPNVFGALEDMAAAARLAHEAGALFVAVVDPVSLGLLAPPGEYRADIVVGEGQALGNPMSYGGPGLGFMAVTARLMRRLPGRLVGETVDAEGRRGFVLTLQTREQHIRREKATSNICSNHALNALAAVVYLSWLGKEGFPALAELCARRAAYLRERLLELPGVEAYTAGPVFREFVVRLPLPATRLVDALVPRGFLAGVPMSRFAGAFGAVAAETPSTGAPSTGAATSATAADPAAGGNAAAAALDDVLLLAVTEKRTREQIDAFVAAVAEVLAGHGEARGGSSVLSESGPAAEEADRA
ncbi:MAG: aminomethyl-transferring glycine dehydrogenase subunit GcvPA [Thermoleophilia bacterium]|nr:aminomethyl-transferring glycine dehydrogenase subunit GcvPA [Thermoleophilia bacterium]